MMKENELLYEQLVKQQYDAIKEQKDGQSDEEMGRLQKLATGSILTPMFPAFTKEQYQGTNLSRFGKQSHYALTIQEALHRHEEELKKQHELQQGLLNHFKDNIKR